MSVDFMDQTVFYEIFGMNLTISNPCYLKHGLRWWGPHCMLYWCISGCHVVAPSDMMDNRIAAIKELLEKSGYGNIVRQHNVIWFPLIITLALTTKNWPAIPTIIKLSLIFECLITRIFSHDFTHPFHLLYPCIRTFIHLFIYLVNFFQVSVMSYSAKFASSFYGPFRLVSK